MQMSPSMCALAARQPRTSTSILCLHPLRSFRSCCRPEPHRVVSSLNVCGGLFIPSINFAVSSRPARRTRPTAAGLSPVWVTGPHRAAAAAAAYFWAVYKELNRADDAAQCWASPGSVNIHPVIYIESIQTDNVSGTELFSQYLRRKFSQV